MDKKTLTNEIEKLKRYLKKISKENKSANHEEDKITANTLVGMLMTIHNLIKTGAYNLNDFSHEDFYETISEARHAAIHYGFFDDYKNIENQINSIVSNIPDNLDDNFANTFQSDSFVTNCTHYQISSNASSKIQESLVSPNLYIFKNLKTNAEIYIYINDLILVENDLTHAPTYLLKDSDEPYIYYKSSPESETEKITLNYLMNETNFFEVFTIKSLGNKLDVSIEKLTNSLKDNPYDNCIVNYKYDDKLTSLSVQNLLQNFIYGRTINEKILHGHFSISNYEEIEPITPIHIKSLPTTNFHYNASITDLFYMDLFLKRYKMYKDLIELCNDQGKELSIYAKQSLLLSLYEVGIANISQDFINTDKGKKILEFYFQYKRARNQLAHNAITDKMQKKQLIENMEVYADCFYQLFSIVCDFHDRDRSKNIYTKHLKPKFTESDIVTIHNKTSKFAKFKHTSICKIVDGKKYLKIDCDNNNTYLEIDGTLLALDYNTMISKECIVPIEHIRLVNINPNTNRISAAKTKVEPTEIIGCDQYMQTLLQAQELLKDSTTYRKKVGFPYFAAITFYDKHGTPVYTEKLQNIIYRRLSQKIIPNQLLDASTLVVSKDMDEPLTILNKNKTIVAKVYWACINYIDREETIVQLTQDKQTRPIEYGKILPKDLKTNEIVLTLKEGRKQ